MIAQSVLNFGTIYKPAVPVRGQPYWKLISAEGPEAWGGRHSVYVDVLDEVGLRLIGIPVLFYWNDGDERKVTEAKTGEPFAIDFPMYAAGNAYGIKIVDGLPSDQFFGMGLVANQPHMVFKLVFQRTVARGTDLPQPPTIPPVVGGDKYKLYRNDVMVWES